MQMRLNGELLEEVDCFKCRGLQVATDGGCEMDVIHRMTCFMFGTFKIKHKKFHQNR